MSALYKPQVVPLICKAAMLQGATNTFEAGEEVVMLPCVLHQYKVH